MSGLNGKKIGIAAARKADVITTLIEKHGGASRIYSIQGEQILNINVSEQDVVEFIDNPYDIALLTTGIGAETLEKAAAEMNKLPEFIQKLADTRLVIRGSKTLMWLKRHSLSASLVAEDGTMENLLSALALEGDGEGKTLFLQAYNQDDVRIKAGVEALGYRTYLSKPYRYKEPNRDTLSKLKQAICNHTVDAVIFTSKTQVQNLFQTEQATEDITTAFNQHVLAVAVGKVTAQSLKHYGVSNTFHPSKPKMGAMVVELERYLARN